MDGKDFRCDPAAEERATRGNTACRSGGAGDTFHPRWQCLKKYTTRRTAENKIQAKNKNQKRCKMIYIEMYRDKFGVMPQIPLMQSNGTDDRFAEMVMMAIKRGTPLTEEDYDKYFPTDPDALY